jgi:hypothetical protein
MSDFLFIDWGLFALTEHPALLIPMTLFQLNVHQVGVHFGDLRARVRVHKVMPNNVRQTEILFGNLKI